jgi:hypothetical protein
MRKNLTLSSYLVDHIKIRQFSSFGFGEGAGSNHGPYWGLRIGRAKLALPMS